MSYSIITKAPELGTKILGPFQGKTYAQARDILIQEWHSFYSSFPDCISNLIRDEDGTVLFSLNNLDQEI